MHHKTEVAIRLCTFLDKWDKGYLVGSFKETLKEEFKDVEWNLVCEVVKEHLQKDGAVNV